MMKKLAANIARLLSRGGRLGRGFTDRELKFINRRGLKGLSTKQVKSLMDRGMLPNKERVLEGVNRGTENMFQWTPKKFSDKVPLKDADFLRKQPGRITRSNSTYQPYGIKLKNSIFGGRSVTIPDVKDPSGTFLDRVSRNIVARHEAREWVRAHAQLANGMNPSTLGRSKMHIPRNLIRSDTFLPEVGSSHMPGVIHDERVFSSALLNRLGINRRWDNIPMKNVGHTLTRAPRDRYVGNKPLRFEFDVRNQWIRKNQKDKMLIDKLVKDFYGSRSEKNAMQRAYRQTFANSQNERMKDPRVVARYMNPANYRNTRILGINQKMIYDRALEDYVNRRLKNEYGIQFANLSVDNIRNFESVLNPSRELKHVMNLSPISNLVM